MHDYQPEGRNINCLAFRARQIIRVLNRDPSGWWDGEVEGRRGWFPSNYVTCEVGLLTEEELPDMTVRPSKPRVFSPDVYFGDSDHSQGIVNPCPLAPPIRGRVQSAELPLDARYSRGQTTVHYMPMPGVQRTYTVRH